MTGTDGKFSRVEWMQPYKPLRTKGTDVESVRNVVILAFETIPLVSAAFSWNSRFQQKVTWKTVWWLGQSDRCIYKRAKIYATDTRCKLLLRWELAL